MGMGTGMGMGMGIAEIAGCQGQWGYSSGGLLAQGVRPFEEEYARGDIGGESVNGGDLERGSGDVMGSHEMRASQEEMNREGLLLVNGKQYDRILKRRVERQRSGEGRRKRFKEIGVRETRRF